MNTQTITEIYQALRPLILRDIGATSSNSSSGSGTMEVHALDGVYHTGVLSETQAPWAATKNEWATALAAHAALPDVHHAAATAGTLISLSGQQVSVAAGAAYQFIGTGSGTAAGWRNVSELAGNGLTATNGVLAVGVSGLGLSVGADAVTLASSSNPGAASSILATDSSGYLQLVRLGLGKSPTVPLDVSGGAAISGALSAGSANISGSATVIGDLSVGTVLQVNTAGTRVGINRAADQQFDLDVAGAIRGQYLVGKHAIQLSSAIGVWHYDGPAPYNLDYTGSNASHMGVGGTETGGVIYRPGKFGKAVQVAEATTNYVPNPSAETNLTNWAKWFGGGAVTITQNADAVYGKYSAKIVSSGDAAIFLGHSWNTITCAVGQTWTGSFYYKIASGTASIGASCHTSGGYGTEGWPYQNLLADGQWHRATLTVTVTSANSERIAFFLYVPGACTIYIDGVQVEQKAYSTPYCDGSLGGGYSWSGIVHASTSSRTSAYVSFTDFHIADGSAWTLGFWANVGYRTGVAMNYFIGIENDVGSVVWLYMDTSSVNIYDGVFRTAISLASSPFDAWHFFCLVCDGASATFYFDDKIGATFPLTRGVNSIKIRPYPDDNYCNHVLLDELFLLDYVADPKLIRSIYESDAPVFVESSVFHWRSPSRVPIWVDEFGLWARGVSGNEILGLYGGDPRNPTGNVTHSWGGITMEENDIVIGRAAQAAVHWDDSVGSLMIGRSSASNLLLSSGLAQMRDGATVWGSWSSAGMVIGRVANSTSRLEITSGGNISIINRNSSGVDTTAISLSSGGSASFTGSITSSSGTIGGWTIGSNLSATNLMLTPGAANTAHILAGTGSTAGGINSAASGSDIVMWAGATHSNRASAAFRVTAAGALVASSATLTGGSISGVLTIGTSGEIRQGTGTLGTDFTGLRVLQSSNIGQIAIYDNNIKTMRISSDDVRYKMASDFTGIRTIKWLEDTDYSGSWSDLSSANGNYAYIGAYYTSTNSYLYLSSRVNNTGSPANTRYSAIWLVPSRNESSTIYSNSLALYTFNATYSYEGAAIFTGMYLDLGAVSTPTRPLAQSSNAQVYIKAGNLVVRYNDGGTHRYKYLNLAGTGTTWTHTTTPP